jgi:uncharacterized protein (TIGR02453 family)
MAFAGFPPEAVGFLRELEANNEREWFRARRADYEAWLAAPARALAEELGRFGRPRFFRPYNDTRFHPGPPIKEQLGLALGHEGGATGAYVELSLDGLLVAAGMYDPRPDQVERLRRAVDDGRTAAGLTRALRRAERAGLELNAPDLKRGPRGFPADHPRADLLRRRRLTVHRLFELEPWLHTPQAGERIAGALDAAQPVVTWLRTHVGPPQAPATAPAGS